jgi:ribosomal protein L3 glutamine methyltransferase
VKVSELIYTTCRSLTDASVFFGHGTDNAWDEAVALVLGVTQLPDDRASLATQVSAAAARSVAELLERRITDRVPLAYLLGKAQFAGMEFLIEPGVVIPRSPIGELLETALRPWVTRPPRTIIDVCCGSGCIGIACARRFAGSQLTLVDIDAQAVAVARKNVLRHGLADRATVLQSDLFAEVLPGRFDLILCNPPYVDAIDMASLPPEYRHEPVLGLAGGDDGLTLVHRLLEELPQRLSVEGVLVCEVGASAPALLRSYPQTAFFWPDLVAGGEGIFILEGNTVR